MRFLKKLSNPFALVVEGFVVGAVLFAASTPSLLDAQPTNPRAERLNAAAARL
jgi:hypothetical protein